MISRLLLLSSLIFLSSIASAAKQQDTPEFSINGQGLWGPGPAISEFFFKTDLLDLDENGSLGVILDAKLDLETATLVKQLDPFCPGDSFFDLESGECFICPDGFDQVPFIAASNPAVCSQKSNETRATRVGDSQFLCADGEFIDFSTNQCASCPAGFSQDTTKAADQSGVCFKIAEQPLSFKHTIGCDAGEFDGLNGRCLTCPVGFETDIFGNGCSKITKDTIDFKRSIGCGPGEFDGLDGSCYICPSGFQHNPALPVSVPGVCFIAAGASKTIMQSAGECSKNFLGICNPILDPNKFLSGTTLFQCPSGFIRDNTVGFNQNGICVSSPQTTTANRVGSFGSCRFSELRVGNDCYACPTGFNQDFLVPFNQNGICTRTETRTAIDAGAFRSCDILSGQVTRGNNCFECPANSTLNVITGVCEEKQNTVATLGSQSSLLCPDGQFFDVATQDCFICNAGQEQDITKSGNDRGVCFSQSNSLPDPAGKPDLICPAGTFVDIVTLACYSCPADYVWNPLVPVSEQGVCFNIIAGENLANPTFQAGIQADYDLDMRWGVSGGALLDSGTVSIEYKPAIEIEYNKDTNFNGEGDLYVISSAQIMENSALSMNTSAPGLEAFLDTHVDAKATLNADVAFPGISTTGQLQQERFQFDIFNIDTQGEQTPDPNNPLVNVGLGVAGINFDILGNSIFSKPLGVFTHSFEVSLTGVPKTPKDPTKSTSSVPIELSYVLAEFTLQAPDLTTPIDEDCLGIIGCFLEYNDLSVKAPPVYYGENASIPTIGISADDTAINNYLRGGERTGFISGFMDSGLKVNDALKFELDIDGLVSFVTQQATGVPVPLGVNFGVSIPLGSENSDPKNSNSEFSLPPLLAVTGNLVDLDAAAFVGIDVSYSFKPNLMIEYIFNHSVMVKTSEEGDFFETNSVELPLGKRFFLINTHEIFNIETRYSLANNEFTNNTDLVLAPVIEGEILSGNWEFIGMPESFPNEFSAASVSLDLSPTTIKLIDINFFDIRDKAIFSLSGFDFIDGPFIQLAGTAITPTFPGQNALTRQFNKVTTVPYSNLDPVLDLITTDLSGLPSPIDQIQQLLPAVALNQEQGRLFFQNPDSNDVQILNLLPFKAEEISERATAANGFSITEDGYVQFDTNEQIRITAMPAIASNSQYIESLDLFNLSIDPVSSRGVIKLKTQNNTPGLSFYSRPGLISELATLGDNPGFVAQEIAGLTNAVTFFHLFLDEDSQLMQQNFPSTPIVWEKEIEQNGRTLKELIEALGYSNVRITTDGIIQAERGNQLHQAYMNYGVTESSRQSGLTIISENQDYNNDGISDFLLLANDENGRTVEQQMFVFAPIPLN